MEDEVLRWFWGIDKGFLKEVVLQKQKTVLLIWSKEDDNENVSDKSFTYIQKSTYTRP